MTDVWLQPFIQEVLRDAVTEVLEKMFFIRALDGLRGRAELPQEVKRRRAGNEMAARVTFHGAPSGSLALRLDRPSARAIAADFLGEEEPELGETQVEEVIGELTNMVCGAVLSRVESAASFRLDQPVIVDPGVPEALDPETAIHVFPIGSGALTVKIWMEASACVPFEESAF